MTETLGEKLIRCGWVTNFNVKTLVRLIEEHFSSRMTTDYRTLCEELLKHLEWYIEEDDTNEGEENEYWLKGKRDAMEVVSKTKKVFLENPQ
jgi:hypothetical protein